ncbi:MAG: ATP-binding protein [Bacteriovorax sp.]|nr:ATP-binding protein [Bacteriovorax sp.]
MENKLKALLKKEVALKGQPATLAFGLFAIFTFFYGFSIIKYLFIVKALAVLILIISITRFILNREILKADYVSAKNWKIQKILIWINSIAWGIILNLASFELKLSGIHFIVVTTFLAGFVGASIVTLSYFSELFLPFQFLLLLPQIAIIIYFYFSSNRINNLPLIILYAMYFMYQIRIFLSYRREMIRLFKYQISLENKNNKLKASQLALIEQSILLAHASRLGALGEMSATITHEINNPIAIVSASSKMISKEIDKELSQKDVILLNIDRINHAVSRIVKIIKGLNNLAYQSDHLPKEDTSLVEIIDETTFFCKDIVNSQNIKLIIGNTPNVLIFCHSVQISQVLINLIKNATDVLCTEELPSEKWISIQFINNEKKLEILVSNGGTKISPEIGSKIFKPFFTTKKIGSGTGIGLTISTRIMNEHNGSIMLDYNADYTTFVLTFLHDLRD